MISCALRDSYDGSGKTLTRASLIVVHHCSLATKAPGNPSPIHDGLLTGHELARRFRDPLLGTGGRTPYHALIRLDGITEQLLPLDVRGSHCRGANWRSLAVACAGESGGPTRAQWSALVRVCAAWVLLSHGARILGHSQVPGGSADPHKQCPGLGYDFVGLHEQVMERLPADWRSQSEDEIALALRAEGWTLTSEEVGRAKTVA